MLTTTGDVPNMPLRLGGPGGHALQARHLPALLQRHRLQRLPRLPLVQVADLIPLGLNCIAGRGWAPGAGRLQRMELLCTGYSGRPFREGGVLKLEIRS